MGILTEKYPCRNTPTQCNLIGVLKIPTHGDAAGNGSNLKRKFFQFTVDIKGCGIPFQRGTKRQYDLFDFHTGG